MYKVLLTQKAKKFYTSANRPLAQKIARCLEVLEQTPRSHPNIKPLKGNLAGRYRYRIGDYRVIYQIDDENNQVIVSLIIHRRDAYE
ncbi:MAG: type II toxin-antitoxin system RelE/ParE family toxin [Limnoraphis robusta]|uniref:Type II toxin-antitoxin system RelE/ParE family toxin n=1 Tax=Limnoraphis robusta CCNP1315 TaxID=3110306 RepID=A0ABU5TT39_9CYAN|nr:type II toxin-antitoxin system RelE/ParE family toxin [Limnoraphis robusta]MEA5499026.1 type II toxin-antitoxin system RelE/ParE family toxin [Limnoraphis robusta BA-68 BA1]MEA5518063.1 type II toxin-antitoxin system RelE/ParE family toxin [Limnoraphis robusta CCNP1315]MEA5539371.1 type II toxin-antitoxin system RelE/ParE family toxin [Limnoraphis robusta Tam1]MEA5547846.1 type II toxin-antitoxin system RelE/ParE family toxin [Limnoraphis robusta CCNP1324]